MASFSFINTENIGLPANINNKVAIIPKILEIIIVLTYPLTTLPYLLAP